MPQNRRARRQKSNATFASWRCWLSCRRGSSRSNRSRPLSNLVSATPTRRLELGDLRLAAEFRGGRDNIGRNAEQRPPANSLSLGNVDLFAQPRNSRIQRHAVSPWPRLYGTDVPTGLQYSLQKQLDFGCKQSVSADMLMRADRPCLGSCPAGDAAIVGLRW
jgi:hypothetical protein